MVPDLVSSAKERIVIAGINSKKTTGAKLNKPLISANPLSNILSGNGNIHRNNPVSDRKTPITIYPIRELKKLFISLTKRLYINYFKILITANVHKNTE
jgi:hypothetical protein